MKWKQCGGCEKVEKLQNFVSWGLFPTDDEIIPQVWIRNLSRVLPLSLSWDTYTGPDIFILCNMFPRRFSLQPSLQISETWPAYLMVSFSWLPSKNPPGMLSGVRGSLQKYCKEKEIQRRQSWTAYVTSGTLIACLFRAQP